MYWFLSIILFAACAPAKMVTAPPSVEAVAVSTAPATASGLEAQANFVVVAEETVENPDKEGVSATRVYVDGELVGQTPSGLMSVPKRWEGVLAPGNHLVRLERWVLPGTWDWVRGYEAGQPRERFFRVVEGNRTTVAVRYWEDGRRYSYDFIKEGLPSQKQ